MPNITNHKGLWEYHPEYALINESAEVPVSICPDLKLPSTIIFTVCNWLPVDNYRQDSFSGSDWRISGASQIHCVLICTFAFMNLSQHRRFYGKDISGEFVNVRQARVETLFRYMQFSNNGWGGQQ